MESVVNEERVTQFYNLCHDIKTPLAAIMGMTELTWSELEDREKVKDRLAGIEITSNYLLSIINDILEYSKITSGKIPIHNELFRLSDISNFTDRLLAPFFQKKSQNFEIKFSRVYQDSLIGDPTRITQILTNLLTNSMKYTAVGGEVTLEFAQIPRSNDSLILEIRVCDNGIGMSEDFMKTMFEPFSCDEKNNTRHCESTGLGLYITKTLVALMGGEIKVKSKLRAGTTFAVRIPLKIPEEQGGLINSHVKNRETAAINERVLSLGNYDFTGKGILIAEDNNVMLEITSAILKSTGINILSAQNGSIACKVFEDSPPGTIDLILMDVCMPVIDGFEAAKAIRQSAHPDSKRVVIIALTAGDYEEDKKRACAAGMDDYVKKPIDSFCLLGLLDGYLKAQADRT